jgi:hypothetical protein
MRNYADHSILIFNTDNHIIAFFAKKQLPDNFIIPSSYFSRVLDGKEPLGLKDEKFCCHLSCCLIPEFDVLNNKGFDDLPIEGSDGKYFRFYLSEFEDHANAGIIPAWIEKCEGLFEEHTIPVEFQEANKELCDKLFNIMYMIINPKAK